MQALSFLIFTPIILLIRAKSNLQNKTGFTLAHAHIPESVVIIKCYCTHTVFSFIIIQLFFAESRYWHLSQRQVARVAQSLVSSLFFINQIRQNKREEYLNSAAKVRIFLFYIERSRNVNRRKPKCISRSTQFLLFLSKI